MLTAKCFQAKNWLFLCYGLSWNRHLPALWTHLRMPRRQHSTLPVPGSNPIGRGTIFYTATVSRMSLCWLFAWYESGFQAVNCQL